MRTSLVDAAPRTRWLILNSQCNPSSAASRTSSSRGSHPASSADLRTYNDDSDLRWSSGHPLAARNLVPGEQGQSQVGDLHGVLPRRSNPYSTPGTAFTSHGSDNGPGT